jgi:glutamine synthetase
MSYESVGNGGHVHISLWKVNGVDKPFNIVGDPSTEYLMTPFFQKFMAGIKYHFPALTQFMAPTHNSIRRLVESGHWEGNFIVWGYDNKEAASPVQFPRERRVFLMIQRGGRLHQPGT